LNPVWLKVASPELVPAVGGRYSAIQIAGVATSGSSSLRLVGMKITKGHFEQTKLDGVVFAATVEFPGALHEGNGKMQPIIDEHATPEQRQALFNIMSGKNSAEGTLFQILSVILTTIHHPLFVPIELSFDKDGRVARLVAKGVIETDVTSHSVLRPRGKRFQAP
jgi:hypothetical protein